jgi:hypothetical protein
MTGLQDLVRRFREALAGWQPASEPARPFDWEPVPLRIPDAASSLDEAPLAPWMRQDPIPADADFASVYAAMGVEPPAHGYGVERVARMLAHEGLASLDRGAKASAVLAALDAAGAPLADVVQDATLRYKALVAYEAARDLELQASRPCGEGVSASFEALQRRRRREQQRLREVLAHFVLPAQNPIPAGDANGSRAPANGPEA